MEQTNELLENTKELLGELIEIEHKNRIVKRGNAAIAKAIDEMSMGEKGVDVTFGEALNKVFGKGDPEGLDKEAD